jgi:hypothetical protein
MNAGLSAGSVRAVHSSLDTEGPDMLARRFTIVCLLLTLFGLLFSMLVAEASRPAHSWDIGIVVPCIFDSGFVCASPNSR